MSALVTLDRPPVGWYALDAYKAGNNARKLDWRALMVDVDPDDLKNCCVDFPALFYVSPDEYRPGEREVRQCWVKIPGKHRNKDAAWDMLEKMMAAALH